MKIVVGSEHAGAEYRAQLVRDLRDRSMDVTEICENEILQGYPAVAEAAARLVTAGKAELGILICGTGIGISIAANKVRGIRAALCHDVFSAEATRLHNDANILAMGARVIGPGLAIKIVDTFLNTPFSGEERHINRIRQIEDEADS